MEQMNLSVSSPEVVRDLVGILGKKLTAYIVGAKATWVVDRWLDGAIPDHDSWQHIRTAYPIAKLISAHDSPGTVQAWFMGMNDCLGDRAPIQVLRDGDYESVLAAARSFVLAG